MTEQKRTDFIRKYLLSICDSLGKDDPNFCDFLEQSESKFIKINNLDSPFYMPNNNERNIILASAMKQYLESIEFFNINKIDPSYILLVEDGSVDTDKLIDLNINYITYRQGSTPPMWIKNPV